MDLLEKPIVLKLNRVWQAIGTLTVQEALVAMNSGSDESKAAVGLDIGYHQNEDGSWERENPELVPTPWDEWIKLPIRPFDDVVRTSKLAIRVPTVIIALNFAKMPMIKRHKSRENIRLRDNGQCQVSGRFLSKREGNVDHIIPKSRGGKDVWENLVYIDKKLNSLKGNRTLEEMGWKLLRTPRAPKDIPVSETIKTLQHSDWRFFIENEPTNVLQAQKNV